MIRPIFAVVSLMASWALAQEPSRINALRTMKVSKADASINISIEGTRPPTFTVFRLHEPERLVVDISSADASAIKGHHEGIDNVAGIVASQFNDARSSVGRVLVSLKDSVSYDVRAEGHRVLIRIDSNSVKSEQTTATLPAASEKISESAEAPKAATDVVKSTVDEKSVKFPARRLTALSLTDTELGVLTDGEISRFEIIELHSPPRVAIDIFGVKGDVQVPAVRGPIREFRLGEHREKVRLVIAWREPAGTYKAQRTDRGLTLKFAPPGLSTASTVAEVHEPLLEIDGKRVVLSDKEKTLEGASTGADPSSNTPIDIQGLTFQDSPAGGTLLLKLSGRPRWKVERPDASSAVLVLSEARLPKKLEQSLDTSELNTPIKMVSAFSVAGATPGVRLVVTGQGALSEHVSTTDRGLSWKFHSQAVQTKQVAVNNRSAPAFAETESAPKLTAPSRSQFKGKAISFEFKDIDIHNLMRMIAEVSKKNIVVADDVTGRVTIRLRNVPWDQALELILRSKGLGQEDLGNIIRVAPLRTLEEEAKLREERKKSIQRQEELVVQLIAVNYASANDLSLRVKEVLSERGSVTVDVRTNTLIIRDISNAIAKARGLVKSLDTQTPQVLIESRIVEANTNFTRDVGIQWGGNAQMAQSTGNPTGLVFPNTLVARGGAPSEGGIGVSSTPNFAVNLPAAVGTGAGGALGFVFGSAGGAVALNLRLSALENEGAVKTISAPKVTTLDNSPARISQGVSIPFSQVSAGGVNTTFVEARLSLEVTPHITADGSILMTIRAENNQPDPGNTGANGQPSIQRKEANTQVLVKDGDTTVIGGIYVRRGSTATRGVPFLGRIPLIGYFFKNVVEIDTRQELLIFITPRIINQPAGVQAQ